MLGNSDTLSYAICRKPYLYMRIQGMNKDISMITRAIERKTREVIQQISPCPSSFLECEDVGLGGTEAGGLPGVGNVARGREIR